MARQQTEPCTASPGDDACSCVTNTTLSPSKAPVAAASAAVRAPVCLPAGSPASGRCGGTSVRRTKLRSSSSGAALSELDPASVDENAAVESARLPELHREASQISYMDDVRGMIQYFQSERSVGADATPPVVSVAPSSARFTCGGVTPPSRRPYPSEQAAAEVVRAPVFDDGLDNDEGVDCRCHVSFRKMFVAAIAVCVIVACASLYVPFLNSSQHMQTEGQLKCENGAAAQQEVVSRLYDNITTANFRDLLGSIEVMIKDFVQTPAGSAVDALWGSMQARHHRLTSAGLPGECETRDQRDYLAYGAWVQLATQWDLLAGAPIAVPVGTSKRHRAAEAVAAIFDAGQSFGFLLDQRAIDCTGAGPHVCGACKGDCDALIAATFDAPQGKGSTREWYNANALTGLPTNPIPNLDQFNARLEQSSDVQSQYYHFLHRQGRVGDPALRLWSKMHQVSENQSDLLVTLTAPIAYCGEYSCYQGSIGSDVNLRHISGDCSTEWAKLKDTLASPDYEAYLGPTNSSVFIVLHVSRFYPDQQGLLIGASDPNMTENIMKVHAEDSSWQVVRETSGAIINKFGSWHAPELYGEQFFDFNIHTGKSPCKAADKKDCRQVGTTSVALDPFSRWLMVAVLPSGSFDKQARENDERVAQQVEEQRRATDEGISEARNRAIGFGVLSIFGAILFSFVLARFVSQPLHRLSEVMRKVENMDFEQIDKDELRSGHQARIKDIRELQNAFYRLIGVIEAFKCFVPETVVTRIIEGNPRDRRMYVDPREVTCMFMCVNDFDKISESVDEEQLLHILRLMHPVMARTVAHYDGTIAEVLDDGLLVYWNTPNKVEDHSLRACLAALLQVRSMDRLNAELKKEGLPRLSIRIGIHTGQVLTGNIGSDAKMKFGCIGDSVNLASRLNGLCKHFGVQILCSGATHAIVESHGVFCRELASVKVKGKQAPTPIFEVLGQDFRTLNDRGSRHNRVSFSTETSRASHTSSATGTSRSANYLFRLANLGGLRTTHRTESPGRGGRRFGAGASPMPMLEIPPTSTARSVASEDETRSERYLAESVAEEHETVSPTEKELKRLPSAAVKKRTAHSPGARSVRSLRSAPNSIASGISPGTLTFRTRHGDCPTFLGTSMPNDTFDVSPRRRELTKRYEEALKLYQRAEFAEAVEILEELTSRHPDDVATKRLLGMATQYVGPDREILTKEELDEWSGVEFMTKK